jgi:hypothetical protein
MRQRRLGWQPSRFLTDRGEAERAFQLAEQLGSVNAAAAAALLRLAGSLLIEQNDEWLVSRRYLSEASMPSSPLPRPRQSERSSRSRKHASTVLML